MPGCADDVGKLVPHLRRFARALVRGHGAQAADDLVQETVVLAMRKDSPKRGPALVSWCFGSLIRFNRLRQRQVASSLPATDPAGSATPLPFLPKEILRLDALPLDHREVLLLTVLAGMSYAQVAEILKTDLDSVFTRLTQARDLLAKAGGADMGGWRGPAGERNRSAGAVPHLRLVK